MESDEHAVDMESQLYAKAYVAPEYEHRTAVVRGWFRRTHITIMFNKQKAWHNEANQFILLYDSEISCLNALGGPKYSFAVSIARRGT